MYDVSPMTNKTNQGSAVSANVHVRNQQEKKLKLQQQKSIKQEPVCLPTAESLEKMRESRKQIQ